MTAPPLHPDVETFISQHVNSVEQLETLLLMRADPDRTWDAAAINAELRTSLISAADRLCELERSGLIVANSSSPSRYRYEPVDPRIRRVIDLVADAYRERRVSVTILIFSKPPDALREFADAFRIGKGKPNG